MAIYLAIPDILSFLKSEKTSETCDIGGDEYHVGDSIGSHCIVAHGCQIECPHLEVEVSHKRRRKEKSQTIQVSLNSLLD